MSIRRGVTVRGTSNSNARGSSADRRRRKRWLLSTFGNGVETVCYRCDTTLTYATLTVDRIVPGCRGGRYVRSNIRPACAPCNSETGGPLRGNCHEEQPAEGSAGVSRVSWAWGTGPAVAGLREAYTDG